MEHKIPLGSFHRENGSTFSGIPFIPENFQWNEPKSRVPFTSEPEFPEFFNGKWKTLNNPDIPCPSFRQTQPQMKGDCCGAFKFLQRCVDGKHLMCSQSEISVFKFFRRIVWTRPPGGGPSHKVRIGVCREGS